MTKAEFEQEYDSILKSNLNFKTKWIAIDLLRQENAEGLYELPNLRKKAI